MRIGKLAIASALVVGLSSLAINKILEKPTTACVNEVAELTRASDILGAILLASEESAKQLEPAVSEKTRVTLGSPYITAAAISNDGMTVFIKVLLEESATYSPEVEQEVVQIRALMHKGETQCSMGGKKYDVYRAKTELQLNKKMSAPI